MSNFFSFLQATRPQIGLVDRLNLSEIYPEDQDQALRNLLLPPESLDEIQGLATRGVRKEDIRLIAGLESRVIDSLALFSETDSSVSRDVADQIRSNNDIGENAKSSILTSDYSDNIIMLHGGIAANSIEYKFKDKRGNLTTGTVSTSRESLFNSQVDATTGRYTTASYSGTLRVRRRGHYSTVKLRKNLFIEKGSITENPTNTVNIPIYMQTPSTTQPLLQNLKALASKNSPLRVPVRVNNGGSFTIYGPKGGAPYYFGYELRRKSDNFRIAFETEGNSSDYTDPRTNSGSLAKRTINTIGRTGNNQDAYLYIYCAPALVEVLKLEGLGIEEDDATPDLGLVGFDNLQLFSCLSNYLKTIPTWLKVNYLTLEELDIRQNKFWDGGIIEWWDWQTNPGLYGSNNDNTPPVQTATQILAYSGFETSGGGTKKASYDGTLSTATAGSHLLHQTRLNPANNGSFTGTTGNANGIRQFIALKKLRIGARLRLSNPDFSVIFPALETLDINTNQNKVKNLKGNPPKLNNHGNEFAIGMQWQTKGNGSIRDMAAKPQYTGGTPAEEKQFIGQFKVVEWNSSHFGYGESGDLVGGICTNDNMLGNRIPNIQDSTGANRYSHVSGSNSVLTAWEGWLKTAININLFRCDVAFNLALGSSLEWEELRELQYGYTRSHGPSNVLSGDILPVRQRKIKYNPTLTSTSHSSSDIVNAPKLTTVRAREAAWTGHLFSISDAPNLNFLDVGQCYWYGYAYDSAPDAEPGKYIFPTNFWDGAGDCKLRDLTLYHERGSRANGYKFRSNDLLKLINLDRFQIGDSRFTGSFPIIPTTSDGVAAGKIINIFAYKNNFKDMEAVGLNSAQASKYRVRELSIYEGGIDVGGMIVPNMAPKNDGDIFPTLYKAFFNKSLVSRYDTGWNDSSKRGRAVFNALYGLAIAGEWPQSTQGEYANITEELWPSGSTTFRTVGWVDSTTQATGKTLYKTSGVTNLKKYIRVGDEIIIGGSVKGRVGSVVVKGGNEWIEVVGSGSALNYSSTSITFRRAAINADKFFNGCKSLYQVKMSDCSLGGKIPSFENANFGQLQRIELQENLFTYYVSGTLANITGASNAGLGSKRSALIAFDLQKNPLNVTSIKKIISEAWELIEPNSSFGNNRLQNRVTIKLKNTKPNFAAGDYSNWDLDDIFTDSGEEGQEDPLKTKLREVNASRITIELFDIPIV